MTFPLLLLNTLLEVQASTIKKRKTKKSKGGIQAGDGVGTLLLPED